VVLVAILAVARTEIGNTDGYNWAFSLTFSYPLGNRAANNALQQQNLLLKQALIDQRKVQLTVSREIYQTVRNLETASKSVEVRRAATVLARTQLEAEQENFAWDFPRALMCCNSRINSRAPAAMKSVP
jgi:outer membrane protein TolC